MEPPPRPDVEPPFRPDVSTPREGLLLAPPTWRLVDVVPVLLVPYGAALVSLELLGEFVRPRGPAVATVLSYLLELAFAGSVIFWLRVMRTAQPSLLGLPQGQPSTDRTGANLAVGFGVGLAMLVLSAIASAAVRALASALLGHDVSLPQRIPTTIRGPWLIAYAPLIVLVAPVCEEILFRGFVFRAFRARARFWPAALGSAALFSVTHVDLLVMPAIFVDGLLLAYVFERRQRLTASIAAHATLNLIAYLALVATRT
jgi:membrane protease YdiL (CAAX protease family)